MVGAVAEVVEATFCISKKSTGGSAHAVAIGTLDDMGCSRESSASDRVVLGTSPETEDNEIGLLGLPPLFVSNLGRGGPEDWHIKNF